MNIIETVVRQTFYLSEAFIWYRVMTNMLDKKYERKIYPIAGVVLALILAAKTYIFEIPWLTGFAVIGTLGVIIAALLMNMMLFKSPIHEKLIWWGVYYFGLILMELVSIVFATSVLKVPLDVMNGQNSFTCWFTFLVKILTILIFEFFIRIRKGKLQIAMAQYKNLSFAVVFNVILILGTVIVFFNLDNAQVDLNKVIGFFFGVVILVTVLTLTLIFRIEKASRKEIETRLKLQQIEMELKQNQDMISITDNLRKLRHDMNNHIGLIRNFIYTKNYDGLKEYVDQLYVDVDKANDMVISENKILSVMLNLKKNQARELQIEFQSIVAAEEINMQERDITALLGNILDNAIEGAAKAKDKKYIDFSIQKTESGCVINCENSFGEKPVMKRGKLMTSKKNASHHGIGTENIKEIVAKYRGEVRFDFDEEIFSVRIVMPV